MLNSLLFHLVDNFQRNFCKLKNFENERFLQVGRRSYTIILFSSQIKKWSLDSLNKNKILWIPSLCVIRSIDATLNSVCTMCDFINYGTDYIHVCVWEHLKEDIIWSDLHFIVDVKVKILYFHDEDKSWWSSIFYHSVANADCYLYILVLILPELVINCFEM